MVEKRYDIKLVCHQRELTSATSYTLGIRRQCKGENKMISAENTNQPLRRIPRRCQWPAITADPKTQLSPRWWGPASLGGLWVKAVKEKSKKSSDEWSEFSPHKIHTAMLSKGMQGKVLFYATCTAVMSGECNSLYHLCRYDYQKKKNSNRIFSHTELWEAPVGDFVWTLTLFALWFQVLCSASLLTWANHDFSMRE